MSKVIDEKVVEMKFDNKQFEKATAESRTSIKKLKESLNDLDHTKTFENMNAAAKNVKLDSIADSLSYLQRRFSLFGEFVHGSIQKVASSIISTIKKPIAFIEDAIVQGGKRRAMNIENAHFQLQALLKDETKVQEIMSDAMKSVNDTAYAFDEAAKAASMFAASGLKGGDEMLNALKGVVGVAAMTNSEYQGIAQIFTAVAGQGRLMGDQLLQLSSRGLNAAATLAEYFNAVTSGEKEASAEITALIGNLTEGLKVGEADIRDFVSKGEVSFKLFATAMNDAFGESAFRANETVTGVFSNIKAALAKIGAEFYAPLVEQNSKVVMLLNTVKDAINVVKAALVFEGEKKGLKSMAKLFSDSVLDMADKASKFIKTMDFTKPVTVMYAGFLTIQNVLKAVGSVLSPLGKALHNVFSATFGETVVDISVAILKFSQKLILTEESAKKLQEGFEGVFKLGKSLIDLFIRMVKAIIPVNDPVKTLTTLFFDMTSIIGKVCGAAADLINSSEGISKSIDFLKSAFSGVFDLAKKAISGVKEFADTSGMVDGLITAFSNLTGAIKRFGEIASPYVGEAVNKIFELVKVIGLISAGGVMTGINAISSGFEKLGEVFKRISFKKPSEEAEGMVASISKLDKTLVGSSISDTASEIEESSNVIQTALSRITQSMRSKELTSGFETFRGVASSIISWLKDKILPAFSNISLGGIASLAGGLGFVKIVQAIVKEMNAVAQIMENISNLVNDARKVVKQIPKVLSGLSKVLKAYANNENAKAMIKYAAAIAILAASIGVLSRLNQDDLRKAAITIGGLATALGLVSKFLLNKQPKPEKHITTLFDLLDSIVGKFKGAVDNIANGLKKKYVSAAVKNLAESILMVVGSIALIAEEYRRNEAHMKSAYIAIGVISAAIASILGVFVYLDKKKSVFDKGNQATKSMKTASNAVLTLSASLFLVVQSVKSLLKITLPDDWGWKIGVIVGLIGGLTAVSIALNKFGTGGKTIDTKPVLYLATSLILVVQSVKTLMNIRFPNDWGLKMSILVALMAALTTVALAIQSTGKEASISIKATGTILAMCAFLATMTGSLAILSFIPGMKLVPGAVALGALMIALGETFKIAGNTANPGLWKPILAMTAALGMIVVGLGVLSMANWAGLAVAAVAMGGVMLSVAGALTATSKLSNNKAWIVVGEMVAALGVIAYGLYELAQNPWQNLIAAMASVSITLLSMAGAIGILNSIKPNLQSIALVIEGLASMALVAVAINKLAKNPWKELEAAGEAISKVLLSMSAAMVICTAVGAVAPAAIAGTALLDLFVVNFIGLLELLGLIFANDKAEALLNGGAGVLAKMGEAIGAFVGNIIAHGLRSVTSQLPGMGEDLSNFAEKASKFFDAMTNIGDDVLSGVKRLVSMVGAITTAQFINGITTFITNLLTGGKGGLVGFGEQLVIFGGQMKKFGDEVSGVNEAAVSGAANAAEMMSVVARNLPTTGSLNDKIFGSGRTKTLSEFAKELLIFAPSIRAFGAIVNGMKEDSVKGAAAAASTMSEVAKNLPKISSLKDKIFGEGSTKSLTQFGKELVSFGPHIRSFASIVKGVNSSAVSGAAAVGKTMSELAKTLPSNASLKDKIFGSGSSKSLSDFGKELEKFGPSIAAYAKSVSGIEATDISKTIDSIKNLVELAKDMEGIDMAGLDGFAKGLKKLAEQGITNFINAFDDSFNRACNAINKFVKDVVNSIKIDTAALAHKGSQITSALIDGLESSASSQTKKVSQNMNARGQSVGLAFIDGAKKVSSQIRTVGSSMGSDLLRGFDERLEIHSPPRAIARRVESAGQAIMEGAHAAAPMTEAAGTFLGNLFGNATDKAIDVSLGYINQKIGFAINGMNSMLGQARQIATNSLNHEKTMVSMKESLANKRKTIIDFNLDNMKAETGGARASAAENKQIQEEIITDENRYWANLLEVKRAGAEAEKYQSMTVKEFQNEILESTKSALENYTSQLESTRQAIFDQIGLFDELEEQEVKTTEELIDNLWDQIDAYEEYVDIIGSLDQRLGDRELGKYLKQLGIDNLDQLRELNESSDTQLQNYADLYDTKMGLANQAAEIQLSGLKATTERDLSEIFGGMYNAVDFDQLNQMFDGSIQSITKYVTDVMVPLEETIRSTEEAARSISESLIGGVTEGLGGLQESINSPIIAAFDNIKVGEEGHARDLGNSLGGYVGDGLVAGLKVDPIESANAAKQVIDDIINALKTAGEIHSPSALSEVEIGVPMTGGIGVGMVNDEAKASLQTGAEGVIQHVISCFDGVNETLAPVGSTIASAISNAISAESTVFETSGSNVVSQIITGVNSKSEDASKSITSLVDLMIKAMKEKFGDFKDAGSTSVNNYLNEFTAKFNTATTVATTIANNILTIFKNNIQPVTQAGKDAMSGFVGAITAQEIPIKTKITAIADGIKKTLQDAVTPIETAGKDSIGKYLKAFEDKYPDIINLVETSTETITTVLSDAVTDFQTSGNNSITAYKTPIETEAPVIVEIIRSMIEEIKGIMGDETSFKTAGEYAGSGFISGIESKEEEAREAGRRLAAAAIEAMEDELDEASPSKRTKKIGAYGGIGFINGLMPYVSEAAKVGEEMADSFASGVERIPDISQIIESNFEDPVIRPIFDLSGAKDFAEYLNRELPKAIGLSSNLANDISMTSKERNRNSYNVTSGKQTGVTKESVSFSLTQNNYSPKALSSIDIYRQTKNQMSIMKARLDKI